MTFEERKAVGANLDAQEVRDTVAGLAADPRFDAVLGLIVREREEYVKAGSAQGMAAHHGALAHCQGSVYALDSLLTRLRTLLEPGKKRGGERAPAE